MRYAMVMALALVLAMGACDDGGGGEDPCYVTTGTYECSWGMHHGDCSPDIVDAVRGVACEVVIEPGDQCGYLFFAESDYDDDCMYTFGGAVFAYDYGPDAGTSNLYINCNSGESCEHTFSMNF